MSMKEELHKPKRWVPHYDQSNDLVSDSVHEPDGTLRLLHEREQTHGNFGNNAECAERMFEALLISWHATGDRDPMPSGFKLALRMVCLKLARIVSNPMHDDHYDDVKGYTELARKYR